MKGGVAEISINERDKEEKLVYTLKEPLFKGTQGSIGVGVNGGQKAIFSRIVMTPIRIKKEEAAAEGLKEMAINLEGPKLSIQGPSIGVELTPESVMKAPSIPNVAIGLDGGMAPNEPEVKLDVSECTK